MCGVYKLYSVQTLITLLEEMSSEEICSSVNLCSASESMKSVVDEKDAPALLGDDECVNSIENLCSDMQTAIVRFEPNFHQRNF